MKKDIENIFIKSTKKIYKPVKPPRNKETLDEDSSSFISMKKSHYSYTKNNVWDSKEIGTNLGLLRSFLRKRIGEDWNDVYSEIHQSIDKNSYKGQHLSSWIYFCVEKNCIINEQKEVCSSQGTQLGYLGDFYIDPITNKLNYIKLKMPKRKKKINLIAIGKDYYYNKDEIWYKVKMQEYEKNSPEMWRDCFVTNSIFTTKELVNYANKNYGLSPQGKTWFCCEKKSANKQQIKKVKDANNIT